MRIAAHRPHRIARARLGKCPWASPVARRPSQSRSSGRTALTLLDSDPLAVSPPPATDRRCSCGSLAGHDALCALQFTDHRGCLVSRGQDSLLPTDFSATGCRTCARLGSQL